MAAEAATATEWPAGALRRLCERLRDELTAERTAQLRQDEAAIYTLQDRIKGLHEDRHSKSLELRNVDRKINFLVQSRLQKDVRREDRDKEAWFEFFDQSASQDNPLGLKKSDYAAFLYLLRLEPAILAKAVMGVPYGEMDYIVQILNFSLFPDLFQAREEIFLLELCKHIIAGQVQQSTVPQDMFRQNSFVTKLLGGYTKRHHGRTHLITCLKDILREYMLEAEEEGSFELRPEAIHRAIVGDAFNNNTTEEDLQAHPGVQQRQRHAKERVECYAWKVLRSLKDNLPSMPFGMRYICKQMLVLASKKFELNEKQRFTLISSFIILRYFNPAILVPAAFGLADRDFGGAMRRSLTLLTKVLQSYANEIVFGGKESFMAVFNESRDTGVQFLKEYCFMMADVPEPHDYYATVANLPQRKDEMAIFQNTTITMSPNELYTIHRLIASHKADLIPPHHPLGFFLDQLGAVPDKVPRAEDKFFAIQLASGDDEGALAEQKDATRALRAAAEALANVLVQLDVDALTPPAELTQKTSNLLAWLLQLAAADNSKRPLVDRAFKAMAKLPAEARTDAALLGETDRFVLYRQAYRSSLAKEKLEMAKSIKTLQSEVDQVSADLSLWQMYVNNIVHSTFKAKLASKREYMHTMMVGPYEYTFAQLDKAGCFVSTDSLDAFVRKNAVFVLATADAGVVEMVVRIGDKESRPLRLSVLNLLDLLVTQDHIKIEVFLFDIRGLCAFLNGELCG